MNATQLVHEILESNKVESFEIFKQLAKREMAYIKEILSWMSFKNIKDAEKAVNYLFEIIGTNLDDDKKFLKLKKKYYKKSLVYSLITKNITNVFKKIFSLKIRKEYIRLVILSKTFLLRRDGK